MDVKPLSIPVTGSSIIRNINKRFKECQTQHQDLCPPQTEPILPNRVIEMPQDGSDRPCRLYITKKGERGRYTSLSYCWGGPQDNVTTAATLESHRSSMQIEKLSQSVQDAIAVTQSLGIRFLWVDALCIMQDDVGDKAAEISAMGEIYKNATVTIAAASSASANEGFLEDRPIPDVCQLPLCLPNGHCGKIWLRGARMPPAEPLEGRAWALQESLLSPRLLYYGKQELLWACQTSEFEPVNETHHFYTGNIAEVHRLPSITFGILKDSSVIELASQSEFWGKIVMNYSARHLTRQEDRLPALAGLASELQKVWKDSYLAGMWRNCLVAQLGWLGTQRHQSRMKDPYIAPSWSWASFPGYSYINAVDQTDAEVVECVVTPLHEANPQGEMRYSHLKLRAKLVPRDDSFYLCRLDYREEEHLKYHQDTRFLLLGCMSQGLLGQGISCGLILSPVENGTYRRIGHWTNSGDSLAEQDAQREVVTII